MYKVTLKNGILKGFIFSLVSILAIFKACAVLITNSDFLLDPYQEMLVLGMVVIWESFMLLSSK